MAGLTPGHLILILVIALVVIGPGKLPEVGAALGKSFREFQKATGSIKDAVDPAQVLGLGQTQQGGAQSTQQTMAPQAVPQAIPQQLPPMYAAQPPVQSYYAAQGYVAAPTPVMAQPPMPYQQPVAYPQMPVAYQMPPALPGTPLATPDSAAGAAAPNSDTSSLS